MRHRRPCYRDDASSPAQQHHVLLIAKRFGWSTRPRVSEQARLQGSPRQAIQSDRCCKL